MMAAPVGAQRITLTFFMCISRSIMPAVITPIMAQMGQEDMFPPLTMGMRQ